MEFQNLKYIIDEHLKKYQTKFLQLQFFVVAVIANTVKQSVDFICNLDKDCFVIRSSLLAKTIKTLFILIFNS